MADNSAQKNSPSFRLAALDPDFLLGDSMRGVRLQIEYEKAEERLRAWTVRSTIVVFGSARMRPGGAGARMVRRSAVIREDRLRTRRRAYFAPWRPRQCDRDRRWTGHHGGGQSRRGRRRRAIDRI